MKNKVIKYIAEHYRADIEYLWAKAPECGIFRHGHNRKWFAVLLLVKKSVLGLEGEEEIFILDVKVSSDTMEYVPLTPGFLPGYHMNKKYWMTILLDGSVPAKVVYKYIDESYKLTQ